MLYITSWTAVDQNGQNLGPDGPCTNFWPHVLSFTNGQGGGGFWYTLKWERKQNLSPLDP